MVGIELSEIGVLEFFEENGIPYSVTKEGEFAVYEAKDRKLKLINGDFYKVTPEVAGTFEAVWDSSACPRCSRATQPREVPVCADITAEAPWQDSSLQLGVRGASARNSTILIAQLAGQGALPRRV